jgi:hypothetical protein
LKVPKSIIGGGEQFNLKKIHPEHPLFHRCQFIDQLKITNPLKPLGLKNKKRRKKN